MNPRGLDRISWSRSTAGLVNDSTESPPTSRSQPERGSLAQTLRCPGGGFRTLSDAGLAWTRVSDYSGGDPQYYGEIFVDPHQPDTIWVGNLNERGVYRTDNGGQKWFRRENGITEKHIKLDDATLKRIISHYTRESGLRSLERAIGKVCRKVARRIAEGGKGPYIISQRTLSKYLGPPRFLPETEQESIDQPGLVTGLAWTETGGEIL